MVEILNKILANQEEILSRMAKLEQESGEFVTPDDALRLLGYKATKNGRRRLQFLRDRNELKNYTGCRPYLYERAELLRVSQKIQSGELIVPTKF